MAHFIFRAACAMHVYAMYACRFAFILFVLTLTACGGGGGGSCDQNCEYGRWLDTTFTSDDPFSAGPHPFSGGTLSRSPTNRFDNLVWRGDVINAHYDGSDGPALQSDGDARINITSVGGRLDYRMEFRFTNNGGTNLPRELTHLPDSRTLVLYAYNGGTPADSLFVFDPEEYDGSGNLPTHNPGDVSYVIGAAVLDVDGVTADEVMGGGCRPCESGPETHHNVFVFFGLR